MSTGILFHFFSAAIVALMLASTSTAAETNDSAPLTNVVFNVARAQGAALVPPSVLDVKRAVGRLQEKGITIFSRATRIDTAAGIDELFQKCREEDARIAAQGSSKVAAKFEMGYTAATFTSSVGLVRMHGTFFDLMAPHRVPGKSGQLGLLDEKARAILNAADAAFAAATEALVMGGFINWSVTRGRIFVVADRTAWQTASSAQTELRPVMSVTHPKGTREFFVATSAATNDYTCQAIAYAVAATVLDEFAHITSEKPDAKVPLFFTTGFAADISKLEAALTVEGPVQVTAYKIAGRTYHPRRCVPGFVPPLKAKRLMPMDTLVALAEYPTGGEDMFHLIRQSGALVSALRTKGPLATVALIRAMAAGNDFRKEIGTSYATIQRDLEGCETASATDAPSTKSRFPEYDRFSLLIDPVFNEMTEEYQTELTLQKDRKEKSNNAAKGIR